jgi:hypothetical protein
MSGPEAASSAIHCGAVIPRSNHSAVNAGCDRHIHDHNKEIASSIGPGCDDHCRDRFLNNCYRSIKWFIRPTRDEMRIYLIAGENRLKSLAFCAARSHIVAVR